MKKIYRKKYDKKYRDTHKIEIRTYNKKYAQMPGGRFAAYRQSARIREMSFSLTFEQFMTFWQKPCGYCGSLIETIGLDRIDSDKGYTIGNVVSCCGQCNKMKSNSSTSDFINHCRKIIGYLQNGDAK